MPSWSWLRDLFGDKPDQGGLGLDLDQEGHAPPSRDTLAAIGELSRAVRNNPDAIEPYLALGNLYRAQGEIERAVELRANIIDRKGIPPALKAKALFELGRDYKRSGFMDRALGALEKARELVGNEPAILGEMARLAAETGEYAAAADLYARLGHPQAQAHYLVRLAVEGLAIQEVETGRQLISQALAVHPGSPEAWAETVILDLQAGFPPGSEERLAEALDAIEPGLRFVVLEMLLGSLPLGVFEPPDRAFPRGSCAPWPITNPTYCFNITGAACGRRLETKLGLRSGSKGAYGSIRIFGPLALNCWTEPGTEPRPSRPSTCNWNISSARLAR